MKLKKLLLSCIVSFIIVFILQANVFAANSISTNSEAAILIEVSTGRILYDKNSTKIMYPASTTKMMTAILVLENANLNDMVTVSESALSNIPNGYVTCDLTVGEEISVKDLLYALMVPSANDAAYVLAEHVGGSVKDFSYMMNTKARELGCKNTNFVNPNGIHDENHFSTAYDLYLIARYCMQNENFRELVKTTEYTLPGTNNHSEADRVLSTTNQLINPSSTSYYFKNAIGIKTGHTTQAGHCIVAESSRDGLDFIAVVLNSSTSGGRFKDASNLFNYAYDNFTLTKIIGQDDIVDTIILSNATKETKNLNILIDKDITVVNRKDIDMNNVIPEISLDETKIIKNKKDELEIIAPILKGDVIGQVKYKVDDIEYTANLIASEDVVKAMNILMVGSFAAGIILLIFAIKLLNHSKSKKRKKKLKKRTNLY